MRVSLCSHSFAKGKLLLFPGQSCFIAILADYHPLLSSMFFKLSHVKIFTTLTKTFPSGVVSNWEFGQLQNGWFKAQCSNGKERYFPTQQRMDSCIRAFQHKYGYQKRSAELIKQLALPV